MSNQENEKMVGNAKGYSIKNVKVTTDGCKKLYFHVEWEGDKNIDYYELRVFDSNHNCLECCAYAAHQQRVTVNDFSMDLVSGKVNEETFYVELGIAEYADEWQELKWEAMATYGPIRMDIYYKFRLLRKNSIEIR